MRAVLVRVGIDQEYGHWNAPVDPKSKRFVYVPIPENQKPLPGLVRPFDEVLPALQAFSSELQSKDAEGPEFPRVLLGCPMHLDPDFQNLTYGDNGDARGAKVKSLKKDDLVVFYAGLRPVGVRRGLVYALVGLYVVEEIVGAKEVPQNRWQQNADTRKLEIGNPDIIVRAQKGKSGRLLRSIPIGEWRNRAYRVTNEILNLWGGLDVKDGFIQRSVVPPSFLSPEKFYNWFLNQGVALIERNN
jgi:Nucleotide modification associated domain 3